MEIPTGDMTVTAVLSRQCGVIGRRQVEAMGGSYADIQRRLRRREWVRLLPGVYVDHTGSPTWLQRAWAGVIYYWPAALADESALRAVVGPGWRHHDDRGVVRIAVPEDRRMGSRPGYEVRRLTHFGDAVLQNSSPPRMRTEEATLEVAARQTTELATIGMLADACQTRRTTARRLLETLARRSRFPRRDWLVSVLTDIAEGTSSALEHAYLTRVERAHALPRANRQVAVATPGGKILRDVEYVELGLVVELDSRLFHDLADQRDLDLERDLDASLTGRTTIRLGWGQVFGRGCSTAAKVARLMAALGWTDSPRPCGPACSIGS